MDKVVNSGQKKKILVFSVAYYPHLIGGAEIALREITDRIGGDFDIDLITLYAGDTRIERVGNINVYRVGPKIDIEKDKTLNIPKYIKIFYIFSSLLKAVRLHHLKRYNAIWSIMASYSGFAALFFKFINPKIPFLLTLQEGDSLKHIEESFGFTYPFSKYIYRKIFSSADSIQAISYFLSNFAKDMGARSPIVVIPNAVDFDLFSKEQQLGHMNALRSELGIEKDDFVIITTSRLVTKNAVGDIIDALSILNQNVKLLVLGVGYQEEFLRDKVRLLKLEKRVTFVGFVPYKEIPLYLHISNVFIRPSISEGFGNSFIEAMASGIPVIATPVGGIVDFIKDKETGFFCEIKNPNSISDKVNEIIKNRELTLKVVDNARNLVREKYDWNKISHDMKVKFLSNI